MRFLCVYCRPLPESFPAALRQETFRSLHFHTFPGYPVGSYDFTWIWEELGLDDERR